MRSNFFVILVMIFTLFTGCSKQESILKNAGDSGIFITEDDARVIVMDFLRSEHESTKSLSPIREIKDIHKRGGVIKTKLIAQEDAPLVYVLNFKNDMGYAIVAGDTRMQPIIAVTDEGNLDVGEEIENPGALVMLSIADTDYRMAIGLPVETVDGDLLVPVKLNETGDYEYTSISLNDEMPPIDTSTIAGKMFYGQWTRYKCWGNEIECNWGQGAPYNSYINEKLGQEVPAGCVATAVAQILYYWGVNFLMDGQYFDWSLMRKHKSNTETYQEAYPMIGKLFYELGLKKNLDMQYSESGSGAPNENTYRTYMACGLSSGGVMEDYDWENIIEALNDRPVYICGYSNYTSDIDDDGNETNIRYKNGHAWVIDCAKFRKRPKMKYNNKGVGKLVGYQYERLVHCNFGWDGNRNGYYYSGRFDTTQNPSTKSSVDHGKDYFYQYLLTSNCGIYK